MELKYGHGITLRIEVQILLIEPYGIEITMIANSVQFFSILLIEPYGIEII